MWKMKKFGPLWLNYEHYANIRSQQVYFLWTQNAKLAHLLTKKLAHFSIYIRQENNDAAVKRQAEGASNPMYQLANLVGPSTLKKSTIWAK